MFLSILGLIIVNLRLYKSDRSLMMRCSQNVSKLTKSQLSMKQLRLYFVFVACGVGTLWQFVAWLEVVLLIWLPSRLLFLTGYGPCPVS